VGVGKTQALEFKLVTLLSGEPDDGVVCHE
jgi:hypothetical protein